jgi:hypothetical protein
MLDQQLVNILLGGFGALLGIILKTVWDSVKDLQRADASLAQKVAEIEVLVAGSYVKRDDFEKLATAIFARLDKIYDRLETKVDK